MSTCRSCGARITWLRTMAGKAVPVDEDPVPDGNIVVLGDSDTCQMLKKGEETTKPRYISHFATCPQAREWRKP